MERDPWGWLSYPSMVDLVLWAILIAVLVLYLWALAVGPVSALDPAIEGVAPERALMPVPRPAGPAAVGAAVA